MLVDAVGALVMGVDGGDDVGVLVVGVDESDDVGALAVPWWVHSPRSCSWCPGE